MNVTSDDNNNNNNSRPLLLPTKFYYYNCDDYDDKGWGCGYRCVQTLASCVGYVPTIDELLIEFSAQPGHYADMGDISLYMLRTYQWSTEMIQISVRSEIDEFLQKLDKYLHNPENRYTWGLMSGGGVIFLVSDVDISQGKIQIFDPHGTPLSESGVDELQTIGNGGFGWITIEQVLYGSADPNFSQYLSIDEVMIMMNWVVLFFDRN